MRGIKGFLLLALGLLAVGGAGWWLTTEPEAGVAEGGRPRYRLPVTLGAVSRGDVQPRSALTGTVRSARWARLAFVLPGQLAEILAREGDVLVAGQPVGRLDATDQELARQRAEADLAVARRQQDLLLAGERDEVVRRLVAELEAARAQEEVASLEVERLQSLVEESYVTRQETDRAQADHRAAVARRQAAEERLSQAEAGSRPEDLAIAAARVAVAEAALARARRELAKTTLYAPWDGVVVQRLPSVGDHVSAGEEIFVVADLTNLEIDVEVPSRQAMHLGERPEVVLRVDEAPDFELRTTLDVRIEAADRNSRNFRGIVRLDEDQLADDVLRPGMFVRIALLMAPQRDALIVPSDAVRITEQGPILVAARPDPENADDLVGEWIPVRLLAAEDGRTAVEPLDGTLAVDDQVVLTGVDLAYPGVSLLPRARAGPGALRSEP